jgi:hypothetical protein
MTLCLAALLSLPRSDCLSSPFSLFLLLLLFPLSVSGLEKKYTNSSRTSIQLAPADVSVEVVENLEKKYLESLRTSYQRIREEVLEEEVFEEL